MFTSFLQKDFQTKTCDFTFGL